MENCRPGAPDPGTGWGKNQLNPGKSDLIGPNPTFEIKKGPDSLSETPDPKTPVINADQGKSKLNCGRWGRFLLAPQTQDPKSQTASSPPKTESNDCKLTIYNQNSGNFVKLRPPPTHSSSGPNYPESSLSPHWGKIPLARARFAVRV